VGSALSDVRTAAYEHSLGLCVAQHRRLHEAFMVRALIRLCTLRGAIKQQHLRAERSSLDQWKQADWPRIVVSQRMHVPRSIVACKLPSILAPGRASSANATAH
jgi:hypothetical protein